MGVDYAANIGIGFLLNDDDLNEFLEEVVTKEETFRYEDIYSAKTGKKLKPKKIVEHKESHFIFKPDGRSCDEHDLWGFELARNISKHMKCCVTSGNDEYVFGPELTAIGGEKDWGRFAFGPSYSYETVISAKSELDELARKFKLFGITVGEPGVYLIGSVWDY